MGFVKPEIQKKGGLGMAMMIQPLDRLLRNQLTGIPFQRTNRQSVPNEIIGVLVAGRCVVPGSEPVIESVMTGCWLRTVFGWQSQVPFSNVSRGVSAVLQDFA